MASQAEGVGEGGGTALELPPLDVAQTMADMEAGEAQLLDAEASLARRSEVVGLHVHGRLQVLASLQAELQTLHQQATVAPGAAASHEDLGAGLTLRRLSIGGASEARLPAAAATLAARAIQGLARRCARERWSAGTVWSSASAAAASRPSTAPSPPTAAARRSR